MRCSVCGKAIVIKDEFVRIREDRSQPSMVLKHDGCEPDESLPRREMTKEIMQSFARIAELAK